jgi:hypothetical protein
MSARKPQNAEKKPARRKLRVSRETLRDLTADREGKRVKGGAAPTIAFPCTMRYCG